MSDETRLSFRSFAGMAFVYFGKDINRINRTTLNTWEQEVGHLPAEFFNWALERVKSMESGSLLLSNPPRAVKNLWQEWLRSNPDKKAPDERMECPNPFCTEGRFWVYERLKTGELVKRVAICAECRQLGAGMSAGLTRSQAERSGYMLPGEDIDEQYRNQHSEAISESWDRFAPLRRSNLHRNTI